jgi:hypothetical protein
LQASRSFFTIIEKESGIMGEKFKLKDEYIELIKLLKVTGSIESQIQAPNLSDLAGVEAKDIHDITGELQRTQYLDVLDS